MVIMKTVSDVSKVLLSQYDTNFNKALKTLKNRGYITNGTTFFKFNPNTNQFTKQGTNKVLSEFEFILNDSWVTFEPKIIEYQLKKGLPKFSNSTINNFHEYIQQSDINIDNALDDKIKVILSKNESKKSNRIRDGDFSIRNQIQILRNNDVFTDGIIGLYKYDSKTNNFIRIGNKQVSDIFKKVLKPMGYQEELSKGQISNYWGYYTAQLTNINAIIRSVETKTKKDKNLEKCQEDYNKVFKLVKTYVKE